MNGIVSNKGPGPATDTLVIATMYDKNGNVVSIGRAMAEPVNITSHSAAAFGIAITDKLQTYKVKNFSLSADSDQYGFLSSYFSLGDITFHAVMRGFIQCFIDFDSI